MAFGNRSSNQDPLSEINVTPLVDVMLVLLVVFMVTAPLLTQSVKVNLPRTVATSPSPQDHLTTLSIDSTGQVFLDSEQLGMDILGSRLAERLSRDAELTLQFNADSAVAYGKVAELMAVAQRAGVTRLSFLTREQ